MEGTGDHSLMGFALFEAPSFSSPSTGTEITSGENNTFVTPGRHETQPPSTGVESTIQASFSSHPTGAENTIGEFNMSGHPETGKTFAVEAEVRGVSACSSPACSSPTTGSGAGHTAIAPTPRPPTTQTSRKVAAAAGPSRPKERSLAKMFGTPKMDDIIRDIRKEHEIRGPSSSFQEVEFDSTSATNKTSGANSASSGCPSGPRKSTEKDVRSASALADSSSASARASPAGRLQDSTAGGAVSDTESNRASRKYYTASSKFEASVNDKYDVVRLIGNKAAIEPGNAVASISEAVHIHGEDGVSLVKHPYPALLNDWCKSLKKAGNMIVPSNADVRINTQTIKKMKNADVADVYTILSADAGAADEGAASFPPLNAEVGKLRDAQSNKYVIDRALSHLEEHFLSDPEDQVPTKYRSSKTGFGEGSMFHELTGQIRDSLKNEQVPGLQYGLMLAGMTMMHLFAKGWCVIHLASFSFKVRR